MHLLVEKHCSNPRVQRRAEFGIMSPMKKCKVKKTPNGRPEVEVGVQRRRSDIAPMTVEVDLDALRATAARMNDPACDPDAYYVGDTPVAPEDLESLIASGIESGIDDACVVLRADKTVPVQYVVSVIDAVNSINEHNSAKHKVILATSPKK